MTRQALIEQTLQTLSKLPREKVQEVADFAEFLFKSYDEEIIQKGIQKLVSDSGTYDFLKEEEDIYTVSDLKEKY
ncbi:MAG: DUF2281 domain-containing protein [Bacteroidales bacterium]